MKTLFTGGQIFTHDGILEDGWLLVCGEHISAYGCGLSLPEADQVIALAQRALLPGFINLHVHGSLGADAMDATTDSIAKMSRFEAAHGVTAFLPTTMAAPLEATRHAVTAIQRALAQRGGARVLGVHLEGPYINAGRAGAQRLDAICNPSATDYPSLLDSGSVRLITVAPEIEGGLELVRAATQRGIVVAVGHSLATYAQMLEAITAGLSHVTHLYNGMAPLHHREPGVIGAALTQDGLSVELIADLIHLHPAALGIAVRAKPAGKLVLVTDAMRATGMPDGLYELGGQAVQVRQGEARLADGTLAGSTLTMDRAVVNMTEALSLPLEDVVRMAATNPAGVIGIQAHKGCIAPGMDADLIVWDHGTVESTMVEGEMVYERQADLSPAS